jgi:3'(2'), 5'-bisphosphate nucleotidase
MSLSDAELAALLADHAGRLLIGVRGSKLFSSHALGRAGDKTANQFLVHAIRENRPDDGLLSEEMRDDGSRLGRDRVWIIDPVDGTREYGEERVDWAVHVALAVGGRATIGAVALPDRCLVARSDLPPPLAPARSRPRLVVSRTRPPVEADAVASALGAELVPMGSAGAKAMAVVLGQAEVYFHSGGQFEWDSAAPVAVAAAAGLHCSRIDGSEMVYNQPDVAMPDLLICRPELASAALDAVARFHRAAA